MSELNDKGWSDIMIKSSWVGLTCTMFLTLVCAGCGGKESARGRTAMSWEGLVKNLADLEIPARMDTPEVEMVCSADPSGGNDDYNHYARKGPKGWWVLADLQGPGYVSRFWATGGKPHIRLYFDDERRPRVDAMMGDFFCAGPLSTSWLDQQCLCSYIPIPYAKRLIVMVEECGEKPGGWPRLFYQINYSRVPEGARVASFPNSLAGRDRAILEEVRQTWERGDFDRLLPASNVVSTSSILAPGRETTVADLVGPAMIRKLEITPDLSGLKAGVARERVLRDVVLRMTWDDAAFPSVEVPLGDFFGSFWRRRRFNSMYVGMSNATFFARFPMPFRGRARISCVNEGSVEIPVAVTCSLTPLDVADCQWGYFHACWRRSGPQDVGRPHTVLTTKGEGKYVGCVLSVSSLDRSWWLLEGDETIRTDGETIPGWRGTGLEDYFNGGWYYRQVLAHPLSGLLWKSPFSTIQYRFHQPDAVRFNSAIDMQFERGPEQASRGYMESVAYYYLRQPARAASVLGTAVDRVPPPDPIEPALIMNQLLDQERLGDFQGAHDHVDEFLERYPNWPGAALLRLRQIAHRESILGFDAVKDDYTAFNELYATDRNALTQAKTLLWFHESSSNALVGAYCNDPTRVFLDGRLVAEVNSPDTLSVTRIGLAPGRHVVVIETKMIGSKPWAQVYLRAHGGSAATDADWRWSKKADDRMHSADFDDSRWAGDTDTTPGPPEEPFYQMTPNGFAGMQSLARGIRSPNWDKEKGTVYFRKAFEIR